MTMVDKSRYGGCGRKYENILTISVDVEKAKNTLGIFHEKKWTRNKRIINNKEDERT